MKSRHENFACTNFSILKGGKKVPSLNLDDAIPEFTTHSGPHEALLNWSWHTQWKRAPSGDETKGDGKFGKELQINSGDLYVDIRQFIYAILYFNHNYVIEPEKLVVADMVILPTPNQRLFLVMLMVLLFLPSRLLARWFWFCFFSFPFSSNCCANNCYGKRRLCSSTTKRR